MDPHLHIFSMADCNFSQSVIPHLQNGDNYMYFIKQLCRINERKSIKSIETILGHNEFCYMMTFYGHKCYSLKSEDCVLLLLLSTWNSVKIY